MMAAMKRILLVACLLFAAFGQTFDVATVKPAAPEAAGRFPIPAEIEASVRMQGGPGSKSPERIDYKYVTLKMLLERAYDAKPSQIIGPGWLSSERYDVVANVPVGTDAAGFRAMLQHLLTERFKIRMRTESKTQPVYELVVAKGGLRLQPAVKDPVFADDDERRAWMQKATRASLEAMVKQREATGQTGPSRGISDTDATLEKIAQRLSSIVDRLVFDRTGLQGSYSFRLNWVPDGAQGNGPSIYAAVEEQLGLKLQPANMVLEQMMIEAAEKVPTEN
jgi:uncharacterized protein (TIGR03435 family)